MGPDLSFGAKIAKISREDPIICLRAIIEKKERN